MIVCPTITAYDSHEYREQLARIEPFVKRIHIDAMDGTLAPIKSIPLIQTYWPDDVIVDIHMMYQRPLEHIETLVSLAPQLVIVHAEAEGNLSGMIKHLQRFNIKVGIALLQGTQPETVMELIKIADHALIFSGKLGYHGGQADLRLLEKVSLIKSISPNIEIGWDGGINIDNINAIVKAGVTVCNVGNAIHNAENPKKAFERLQQAI